MTTIWVITKLTFREAIRRRILLVGLILGWAFLIIYSLGLHFILIDVGQTIKDIAAGKILDVESANAFLMAGLYIVSFLSIAMGALLASDTFAGEISSGTIQTLATKPIKRSDIVLGKWLGFAGLLALYLLFMAGGIILSMFLQTYYLPDHMLYGLLLLYLESLLIMTVSLMFSSSFSALATGGIVFGLYGLAFIGGWIEQIGAAFQNYTAVHIGVITSLIIPTEALWRLAAFKMQPPFSGSFSVSPFGVLSVPDASMVAYAELYTIVSLMMTIRTFRNRDL